VSGRGERLVPSIARAVGCRVRDDGGEITLLLFASAAEAVCRDVASNGMVAACFSRPSSSRPLQVKGRDARSMAAAPVDRACARPCLDLLIEAPLPLHFERPMLEAFFWGDPADLVAVRFTPDAAFAQTPGPGAGAALGC